MQSAELRHQIDIEERVTSSDGFTWQLYSRVYAAIVSLSAREFLGANQNMSQAEAKITIWYMDGINATMRIRHGETIYNILGVLSDNQSGRRLLTMPVSRGTNEG